MGGRSERADGGAPGCPRARIVAAIVALAALAVPAGAGAAPHFGYSEGQFRYARHLDNGIYPAETARLLALAGAEVQRMKVAWEDIEPEPDEWHWAPYGAMVEADLALGIRPLFVVANAPRWAWSEAGSRCRTRHCNVPPSIEHLPDWQDFVARLLARFPGAVALEVWNEPNAPGHWQSYGGPNPAYYSAVLCSASAAAAEVAPATPVLSGSLNTHGSPDLGFVPYTDFLDGVYDAGGGECLDGLGLHSYPQSPDLPADDRFFEVIDGYRRVAERAGDAGRDLWVTEFGFATPPERQLSEAGQARGTAAALRALQAMPDVRAALIFSLIEGTTDPGFGQVTRNYHAKVAFCYFGWLRTAFSPCDDRDRDGLSDVLEVKRSTDELDPDSDDDGTLDAPDEFPRNPSRAGEQGAPPRITSGPPATESPRRVELSFDSRLLGARFQCRLNAERWSGCSSPQTYTRLRNGTYDFAVRALDAGGVAGLAAHRRFTVGEPVYCDGEAATIVVGYYSPYEVLGTDARDVIAVIAGPHRIAARGGDDMVCGGPSGDQLGGGTGADVLRGRLGDDVVAGARGADELYGQRGNDGLSGGGDSDGCNGGPGEGDSAARCERVQAVP